MMGFHLKKQFISFPVVICTDMQSHQCIYKKMSRLWIFLELCIMYILNDGKIERKH